MTIKQSAIISKKKKNGYFVQNRALNCYMLTK